jgi:hypothetical protein
MIPLVGDARLVVAKKKADATEYPEVFHRVGLLTNEPRGTSRFALYSVFRTR